MFAYVFACFYKGHCRGAVVLNPTVLIILSFPKILVCIANEKGALLNNRACLFDFHH